MRMRKNICAGCKRGVNLDNLKPKCQYCGSEYITKTDWIEVEE